MAKQYFVVLALSGGGALKCSEGECCPQGFLQEAAASVNAGRAKIVSVRCDTGVAEDIRWHVNRLRKFKTYILVNMQFSKRPKKTDILRQAGQYLTAPTHETKVVDASERFQLIAA